MHFSLVSLFNQKLLSYDFADVKPVVSLKTYPEGLFVLAMSVGLYIVRRHNKRVGRGPPEFKAWDVAAIFFILIQIFIIVMPWYPPKGGPYAGDVSFWYAT